MSSMLHLSRFTAVSSLSGDQSSPLLVYHNPLRKGPTHQRCPGRDSLPEVLSRVGPDETPSTSIRPKHFHSALSCYGICSGHPRSGSVYYTTLIKAHDICDRRSMPVRRPEDRSLEPTYYAVSRSYALSYWSILDLARNLFSAIINHVSSQMSSV